MKLTCDLGEGLGNDEALMPFIYSCSIACGYHAGGIETMHEVVLLAKKYNVAIGAHPSFPDRENFGRSEMYLPEKELIAIVKDQIVTLYQICKENKAVLQHCKPHGALYNMAVNDEGVAWAIIKAVQETGLNLEVYTPFHGKLAKIASENNIEVKFEAFADRNYEDSLNLVPRNSANAVITDPLRVEEHVLSLINKNSGVTAGGKSVSIKADVLCVHGDNPNALDIVRHLNNVFRTKD